MKYAMRLAMSIPRCRQSFGSLDAAVVRCRQLQDIFLRAHREQKKLESFRVERSCASCLGAQDQTDNDDVHCRTAFAHDGKHARCFIFDLRMARQCREWTSPTSERSHLVA